MRWFCVEKGEKVCVEVVVLNSSVPVFSMNRFRIPSDSSWQTAFARFVQAESRLERTSHSFRSTAMAAMDELFAIIK